jgi:phage terminase Nu1 subunit (DNA packaging protein)
MLVNKKQLSEIFDISERSFTEYQKDPSFPYQSASRGHENQYETSEVYNWLLDRAVNQKRESAKERLDRVRADREEIALAKDAEQVVMTAEVEGRLTEVALAVRIGMMGGNTKLKNEIDLAHGINLDIDILHTHARRILTHLSKIAAEPANSDRASDGESVAAEGDVQHGLG